MEQIYKFKMSRRIVHDFDRLTFIIENTRRQFIKELNMKFKMIRQMPRMYQSVFYEEKTKTDYRRVVHKKYIIIYKIHNNQITILRIVSEKEDYLKSQFFKSFL